MANLTEEMDRYLTAQGYTTGSTTEKLVKILQTETSLSDNNQQNLWAKYLYNEGYTGPNLINNMHKWLGDKGYTQATTNERLLAACVADSLFTWYPSALFRNGEYGDYWDARDATKLYENTGDSSPNVVDGDPVGKWVGQRGVITLSQSVAGSKPVWKTTYVRGVGVKILSSDMTAQTATTPFTMYISGSVEAWTANGGRGAFLAYMSAGSAALHSCLRHVGVAGANNLASAVKNTTYPVAGGQSMGTSQRNMSLRWSGSGNGTQRIGATDQTIPTSSATTVPANLFLNSEDTQRWYRILYINRQLTAAEITKLETWGAT